MSPINSFEEMDKNKRLESYPIVFGSLPLNLLCERSKKCNETNLVTCNDPFKLFKLRSKALRRGK